MFEAEFKSGRYSNPGLRRIANNYDNRFKPLFEQVKNSWNTPIRNYYKKIMGVGLQDEETSRRQEIKINIKPIYRKETLKAIEDVFQDLDFEEYQKLKAFQEAAENALPYFNDVPKEYNDLAALIGATAQRLLKFDQIDFNKSLQDIFYKENPDIFGRYYPPNGDLNKGEIDLYIVPCILFCERYNLDLDTFVTMILAHELAHGYNHLGIDKDNYHWENFWSTDHFIAEGLAQYYTEEFLVKNVRKLPKGMEIFKKLMSYQSPEYRSFKTWASTPEKIYSAFIETRRNGIKQNEEFLYLLDSAKNRIRGERKIGY